MSILFHTGSSFSLPSKSRRAKLRFCFDPSTHTTKTYNQLSTIMFRLTSRAIKRVELKRFYSPLPRYTRQQRTPREYQPHHVEQPPKHEYSYTSQNTGIAPNPYGLISQHDGISRILNEPTLVIERQIEMMNVFLGFEQANRYAIMDALGNRLGFMEERDLGFIKVMMRQVYRLHRPFLVDVFDNEGNHLLTIKRPFSFINSHIRVLKPEGDLVGESVQSWHLWRRRYNLFKAESDEEFDQFGAIDAPFLSFDFPVRDENGVVIASVDRNWVGLGRELFTDTGVYIVRMDPASFGGMQDYYPEVGGPLTLDQRAVLLANAVSIDFDYFSRHSNGPGMVQFGD